MPPAARGRKRRRGALAPRPRYTRITEVPLGTLKWSEIPPEARKRLVLRVMAWALPVYEDVITRRPITITKKITIKDAQGRVVAERDGKLVSYTETTEYTPDVTLARVWALDLFRLSIGEVGLGRMLESLMPGANGNLSPGDLPPGWMPPLVLPAIIPPREPTSAELAEQERERGKRPGAQALDESLAQMTDDLLAAAAKKLKRK